MSSAQERAAEVLHKNMAWGSRMQAAALAEANLLVDDDTARLVALGRAVEAMGRIAEDWDLGTDNLSAIGWNDCLDAIYREARVGLPPETHDRPLSGPRIDAEGRNASNPPDSSDGHTEADSGGAG